MHDLRTARPEVAAASHTRTSGTLLARTAVGVAAIGIVFGDIGTSPLYALRAVFSEHDGIVQPSTSHVYGLISLIIWAVTLLVTVKYVLFVLRADHEGEGGILALSTLIGRRLRGSRRAMAATTLVGIIGAALFFGDSVITPAVSVLSAVEGLEIALPGTEALVVPIALAVLVGLFALQRFGTAGIGRLFGPIMLIWFVTLALLGVPHILAHPEILAAFSPHHAIGFIIGEPLIAGVALGAVVLAVTGAEALYADLGHFGRSPISKAWLFVVFPALTICYLGQGALVIEDPSAIDNPFFRMAPTWAVLPLIVLATLATVIASQSVISGTFSVARQAMRLGFLPNLSVKHTSRAAIGQIYIPVVSTLLLVLIIGVVLGFRNSENLAAAYGLAVTTTFLLTSSLFIVYLRIVWEWPWYRVLLVTVPIVLLELAFFVSGLVKFFAGGWLPLVLAAALILTMLTWRRGREIVTGRRERLEGTLQELMKRLLSDEPTRVPGWAVYPHGGARTAPLALRLNTRVNHALHEHVLLVRVATADVPHIPERKRCGIDDIGPAPEGLVHITLTYGFLDRRDVPLSLRDARLAGTVSQFDNESAIFFLSRIALRPGHASGMARWRAKLFVLMSRGASSPAAQFGLPPEQTVEISPQVLL